MTEFKRKKGDGRDGEGNNAHTERIIFRLFFFGLFVLQRPLAEQKFKAKTKYLMIT